MRGYARKTMRSIQDITHHPYNRIIEHRVRVIRCYSEYGAEATKLAFGVSRSNVFAWKRKLKAGHGRLEALAPTSTAPTHRRRRCIDRRIPDFIVQQRTNHPRLSKKLAILLKPDCNQ